MARYRSRCFRAAHCLCPGRLPASCPCPEAFPSNQRLASIGSGRGCGRGGGVGGGIRPLSAMSPGRWMIGGSGGMREGLPVLWFDTRCWGT